MSVQDAQEFLAGPFARQAVALRLRDDEANVPDFPVPLLEDYIPQLSTLWR
jgi:predicted HD phosphohydrolase